ncbi:MAG: sel1 repeat family protein [Alphaproteobacteria bacterium]|nr:sel1 repeat family protein [Alphaproteobacteria bacterium]
MNEPEKTPDNVQDDITPAAANGNQPLTAIGGTAQEDASKKKYGWGKKALSITFNIAAGAAAAAAAKAVVAVPMAMMSAPAVATLLVSSFAVGAAMTVMCHAGQTYSAKKKGVEGPKFWTKQNRNVFLKSSGFALIGGALFMGFGEVMDKFFAPTPDAAPAAPVEVKPEPAVIATPEPAPVVEQVIAAPVPVPCPTPMESFSALIDGHSVSERVSDAIARAGSDNARVAAQGAKDLAFFAFNGFDGVPKDPTVAAGLFQQAAEAGNVQAKIDLLYMQFHGLGGVTANPSAALSAMNDIGTPRAEMFVQQWGGADKITERVAFDAKAILSGVKLCPTP